MPQLQASQEAPSESGASPVQVAPAAKVHAVSSKPAQADCVTAAAAKDSAAGLSGLEESPEALSCAEPFGDNGADFLRWLDAVPHPTTTEGSTLEDLDDSCSLAPSSAIHSTVRDEIRIESCDLETLHKLAAGETQLWGPQSQAGEETIRQMLRLGLQARGGFIAVVAPKSELKRLQVQSVDENYMDGRAMNRLVSVDNLQQLFLEFTEHTDDDRWPSNHPDEKARGQPKDGAWLFTSDGVVARSAVKLLGLPAAPYQFTRSGTRHEAAASVAAKLRSAAVILRSSAGKLFLLLSMHRGGLALKLQQEQQSQTPESLKLRLAKALAGDSGHDSNSASDAKIYRLPLKVVSEDAVSMTRVVQLDLPEQFGQASDFQERVIAFAGGTGQGKSTLIDRLVNYVLDVNFEDQFRFKLINDDTSSKYESSQSQTDFITAYRLWNIESQKCPHALTVVDMPGFGDTRGRDRDAMITQQFRDFSLSEKTPVLHAICFVMNAGSARLDASMQYVFSSVLSMFSRQAIDNFFACFTFSDGRPPHLLDTVKEHIPIKAHFKFNNGCLFSTLSVQDSMLFRHFWNMGSDSFKELFERLKHMQPTSVTLSCELLDERSRLERTLDDLQTSISEASDRIHQFDSQARALYGMKAIKYKGSAGSLAGSIMQKDPELQRLHREIVHKEQVQQDLIERARQHHRRLSEIALRPEQINAESYLELLVRLEKSKMKDGWQHRVETLLKMISKERMYNQLIATREKT